MAKVADTDTDFAAEWAGLSEGERKDFIGWARRKKALLLRALRSRRWAAGATAKGLGITYQSLMRAIKRHGLWGEYDRRGHGPGRPRKTK